MELAQYRLPREDAQDRPGQNRSKQDRPELVARYRNIGISAVAAALACEEKQPGNDAAVQVERQIKERDLHVSA